ncbi:WYL domain-containing protein [Ignatzschineria sp. LJL83]
MDENLREKYRFIEFLLLFKGQLTRSELVTRFSIGEATASRIIAGYLEEYPNQMVFLGSRVGYIISDEFQHFYTHSVEKGLLYVAYGVICHHYDIATYGAEQWSKNPLLEISDASEITRSIINRKMIEIKYVSTSSGESIKKLIPHSIFKVAGCWYFRAFEVDKDSEKWSGVYKTFKFTRVLSVISSVTAVGIDQGISHDDEWNSYRRIQIIPHPKALHPESYMLDLGMKNGEAKEILISEVLLGFWLIDLKVDCSPLAQLNPSQYPLYLKNRDELLNVSSMRVAPGFFTK